MALIENIQREDLNPLEEAQGIKRLIDEFAMTHEKAADAVGRSRVAVSNILRLLTLTQAVQEMLMHNKLDMGHARALIGLDAAQQIMFANKIVQQKLSVREVENLVKQGAPQLQNAKNKLVKTKINRDLQRLQEATSEQMGMSVNIQHQNNGKGKLIIHYQNLDELDHVFKRLGIKLDA
jgi:ParB family chromosome partitioning protein